MASVKVEGFAYGGEAFGRLPDGRICFFRGGVPGETAEVAVTDERRSFARGRLVGVTSASSSRIAPVCPLAVRPGEAAYCPGCSYQQVEYAEELTWKQRQLRDFLLRSRLAEETVFQSPTPSPCRFNWRNRLKLSGDGTRIGFHGEDNVTIIPVEHCPLAAAPIDDALPEYRTGIHNGEVYIRWTPRDGVMVNGGRRELTESLEEFGDFLVPATSFFQTNPAVAAQLVRGVIRMLKESVPRSLTELYCGVGVFSLAAATVFPELKTFGIELDSLAIRYAGINAEKRSLSGRCRFAVGKAEKLKMYPRQRPDVLLLDPPRRGLAPELTAKLKAWRIPRLIYVSCAPDTLTRDLTALAGEYRIERCGLYDMFPCTGHFETLTLLHLK